MSSLPGSIAINSHISAIDALVEERMDGFPVEVVMTYLMSILEATAMSTMATDLNVNGVGGMALANTEEERREVLLNAIRTRRKIGTPSAIKDAVQTFGYSEPEIYEGPQGQNILFSGTSLYNGVNYFVGGTIDWAEFYIVLPEVELVSLTSDELEQLASSIKHWKNERSHLIGIGYISSVAPDFDGVFDFDGAINYDELITNTVTFVWQP